MIPFATNALQCIVNGEENPKTAPCPWDFVTLPEEDRARAIGNKPQHAQKIFGKDRECGSGDMLADTQTDTHTHTFRRVHHNTSPPLPRAK